MFQNAIARIPGENFSQGLTTADLGAPNYPKALEQHRKYLDALQHCGLKITLLPADLRFPDSTFVEDTAILAGHCAILTNPGAATRKGEVDEIRPVISRFYQKVYSIHPPGTLEGGDICEADGHFFIGISERTNEEGAHQLADILSNEGYTYSFIDIWGIKNILHLKSGMAYLGERNLILIDSFAGLKGFGEYKRIPVEEKENYAANCIRVNEAVLIPAGYTHVEKTIKDLGYPTIALEMSEYQKMDGGLSCLSLRF
ncbi:MAG: dimethylarginine dimethylaminohydrolase family protein [Omnitrophica WOR_2 bacterium]